MVMDKIPFVDVVLTKDDLEEGIRKILAVAKPEWDLNQPVEQKVLSGGYINITNMYYPASLTKQDGVVIKTADEFFVGPMPKLQHTFQFLHDNGLGPPILAFFGNGHCMPFVDGEIRNRIGPRLFDDQFWQPIITRVAKWQSQEITEKAQEYGLRYSPAYIMPCETEWEGIMSRDPMCKYKDVIPTLQQLLHEERTLVREMKKRGAFKPAVSHGDLNASNIIVNVRENKACLADTDYSGLYVEEFGLASFFGTIFDPVSPCEDFHPNKEFELRVVRHYKQQKRIFDHDESPITEREIEEFWHNLQCAKPLMNLTLNACAVFVNDRLHGVFPQFLLDNWIEFARKLWAEFHDFKKSVIEERDKFFGYIDIEK